MKLGSVGYVFGAFGICPVIIIIINLLCFRGNQVTPEQLTEYINDSSLVELNVPRIKLEEDSNYEQLHLGKESKLTDKVYITGISRRSSGPIINRILFFSKKYNKFFEMINFDGFDYGGQFNLEQNDSRLNVIWSGNHFIVRINNKQWSDTNYGTEKNPIPVFGVTISGRGYENLDPRVLKRDRGYFDVSDKLNRIFVEQYLNYFLPEEDFEKLFSK